MTPMFVRLAAERNSTRRVPIDTGHRDNAQAFGALWFGFGQRALGRAAHLNTEVGLVINSPRAAKQLTDAFETEVPDIAYELCIAPDGANLQWIERTPSGATMVYDVDPETSAWQRFQVGFLAGLPIDWLL